MLKFVTRIKNRSLETIRRLSRVFFTLVVLGGMVGCMLAAALLSQVTLSVFSRHTRVSHKAQSTQHTAHSTQHTARHAKHASLTWHVTFPIHKQRNKP
jgi:hypothetical protein